MQYKILSEIHSFLHSGEPTIEDALRLLCIKTSSSLGAEAAILWSLRNNGRIAPHAAFGLDDLPTEGFHLHEPNPISESIRDHRFVLVQISPKWPTKYENPFQFPLPSFLKTLITWPFEGLRVAGSAMTLLSSSKLEISEELTEFLQAISEILIIDHFSDDRLVNQQLTPNSFVSSLSGKQSLDHLSERQLLILQMISEGRTNTDIADLLAYSESLIRQETIKIYSILGCSGRLEAARMYKAHSKELSSASNGGKRGA